MTEGIKQAYDSANAMYEDCQRKVDELVVLEEVYKKLGQSEEYNSDPDLAGTTIRNYIEDLQKKGYPFPIRGVFGLAAKYHTISGIQDDISMYCDLGNYWIKIRDQLGQD